MSRTPATDVLLAVLEHARVDPGRLAARDSHRQWTHRELTDEAAAVAAGLRARHVGPGDRVCLWLPNSADFLAVALGCLWAGAAFVPLAVSDPEHRLALVAQDCDPALVVVPDEGDDEAPSVPGVLDAFTPVTSTALRARTPPPPPYADPDGVAYAIYTSGTTGTPKGVLISRRAFAVAVRYAADALEMTTETKVLCVSPFHFDGSFGSLFPAAVAGSTITIPRREALLFPRTFFSAVERDAITYTGCSPSYLRLLRASPRFGRLADSSLRIVALGGEALTVLDVEALWALSPELRVFNRYGPTETTIAVSHYEIPRHSLTAGRPVPIGVPHPTVSFRLVDEQGRIVEGNEEVGELYIGGDQLMEGYWRAPEQTAAVMRTDVVAGETLYRTGDLVYRDPVGIYVYVDRADQVIKREGVRISLIEVGAVLNRLDGVTAATCAAYSHDGRLGIAGFVVLDEGARADGASSGEAPASVTLDLRRAAAEWLPVGMLPDRIELVERLPLTGSNKVDSKALLAAAGLSPA